MPNFSTARHRVGTHPYLLYTSAAHYEQATENKSHETDLRSRVDFELAEYVDSIHRNFDNIAVDLQFFNSFLSTRFTLPQLSLSIHPTKSQRCRYNDGL